MNESKTKPSSGFWIISVLALLWNLYGVFQYLVLAYMRDEALADLSEAQRNLYEQIPAWVTGAFAIAVFGGLLGCILLLLRKRSASILFAISLVGILGQMAYNIFLSDAREVYGNQALVMPILVIAVGVFLVWFSNKMAAKGVLR